MNASTRPAWTVDSLHAALNGRATNEQARLIASAPELLAALEACIALLGDAPEWIQRHGTTITRARAIASKARGG